MTLHPGRQRPSFGPARMDDRYTKAGQHSPQWLDTGLGKDATKFPSSSPTKQVGNFVYDSVHTNSLVDNELALGMRGMVVEDDYNAQNIRQTNGNHASVPHIRAPPLQGRSPYNTFPQPDLSSAYYPNNAGSQALYPGVGPQAMYPPELHSPQSAVFYDYGAPPRPPASQFYYPPQPIVYAGHSPMLSPALPAGIADKKRELQAMMYPPSMRSTPSPHTQGYSLDYNSPVGLLVPGMYGLNSPHVFPQGMRTGRRDDSIPLRSPLLEDFRTNKTRKWELRDIFGYIVEFSGDQHGSRFIQQKLESATSDEKEIIFNEIVPHNALQLVQDVFGNYVIQKLFEYGTQIQKTALANTMEGHVLQLSLQMYGCRVVQKAVEYILPDQQASFVREIDAHVLKCVKDANGNHVIQKLIERVSPDRLEFVNAFRGNVYELSTHPYGCRVLQRCFEHLPEEQTRPLLDELHKYTTNLMQDQFGNYVVQFVLEHGTVHDRSLMISKLRGQMLNMSRHKFASNVCEKALVTADPESRRLLIEEIMSPKPDGVSPIITMMKDQFANYVLQRALSVAEGEQRELLISKIRPQLTSMRRYSSAYSKHLISIERLIEKCSQGLPDTTTPTA